MAKKRSFFHLFSKYDDENDYEHYEEDASFKMPIEDIFEGIKNGNIKSLSDDNYLQVEDFLEKDDKGRTLLEYVYEYNVSLSNNLETRLVNNPTIIRECLKHKYSILISRHGSMIVVNLAVNPQTLFKPINNNESLIEYIIRKDIANLFIIHRINDIRILDLCIKYNRLDLIQYLNEDLLFEPYKNFKTLFEYLMSKNLVNEEMLSHILSHFEAFEICKKYNKIYLLKHLRKDYLFYPFRNGLRVIEYLIKSNQADKETFYQLGVYNKDAVINMIIKYKAYRYLVFYPDILFMEVNGKLFLDYLLDNYNKSVDLYLTEIKVDSLSWKEQAMLYMKCAEHGLIKFLPPLTEERLLDTKYKTNLLVELLRIDKKKTMDLVLTKNLIANSNIALALKFLGINVHGADVPVVKKERGTKKKRRFLDIDVSPQVNSKLNQLKRLFLMDGASDEELVDILIASYKNLSKSNYLYLDSELDLLIKYKKRNPNFSILRTDKKPYFAYNEKTIYLNDSTVDAFNHELGHALHAFGCNRMIPKDFKKAIARIYSDNNGLNRVDQFAIKYNSIERLALKEAERTYERDFGHYFDNNKTAKIKQLIQLDKKEKIERFKDIGISPETLSKAIDSVYDCSEDDYVEIFKRVKIEEIKTSILYEKYTAMSALGDILDAIYKGRLLGEICKNSKGETIKITFGHGLYYYNNEQSMFDEIIADYSQIIKEKDGKEVIEFLRYIVGDDFVDMISNFYRNEVVGYVPERMPIEEGIGYER